MPMGPRISALKTPPSHQINWSVASGGSSSRSSRNPNARNRYPSPNTVKPTHHLRASGASQVIPTTPTASVPQVSRKIEPDQASLPDFRAASPTADKHTAHISPAIETRLRNMGDSSVDPAIRVGSAIADPT